MHNSNEGFPVWHCTDSNWSSNPNICKRKKKIVMRFYTKHKQILYSWKYIPKNKHWFLINCLFVSGKYQSSLWTDIKLLCVLSCNNEVYFECNFSLLHHIPILYPAQNNRWDAFNRPWRAPGRRQAFPGWLFRIPELCGTNQQHLFHSIQFDSRALRSSGRNEFLHH